MRGNKLRKTIYLLAVIFVTVLFCPDVYAKDTLVTCNYKSDNYTTYKLTVYEKYKIDGVLVNFKGERLEKSNDICNWKNNKMVYPCGWETDKVLIDTAKVKSGSDICPPVIVAIKDHGTVVYGFYSTSDATDFINNERRRQLPKTAGAVYVTINDTVAKKDYDLTPLVSVENGSVKTIQSNDPDKAPVIDNTEVYNECTEILGKGVVSLLQKLFNWIKVLGPILVLILSSLDFTKTVLAGDEDSMKKSQKRLGARLLCAAGLYFLPIIVTLIINLIFGTSGDQICGIK